MSHLFTQAKAKFLKNSLVQKHKLLVAQDNHFTWNLVVLGCIALVGVAYLVEVNGLATKGYKIRELEKSITRLQVENDKIQLAVVEARSLATLTGKIPSFALIPSERLRYLDSHNVAIAK